MSNMLTTSSSGFLLMIAFIVPGFIIYYIRSKFMTGRMERGFRIIIELFSLGSINIALWSWLIFLWLGVESIQNSVSLSIAIWVFVILLSPLSIGILLAYSAQNDWGDRCLQWIGLRPVHPIPTAWDWVFSRIETANWLIVTLYDGKIVAGFFGRESFASSDPSERDLYIEQVFHIRADGRWTIGPEGKGILLKGDNIAHIEMLPVR